MFVNSHIMPQHNGNYCICGFIERGTKHISAGGKEEEALICFTVLYSIYRHLIFCEHKCQLDSRDLWIKCCCNLLQMLQTVLKFHLSTEAFCHLSGSLVHRELLGAGFLEHRMSQVTASRLRLKLRLRFRLHLAILHS